MQVAVEIELCITKGEFMYRAYRVSLKTSLPHPLQTWGLAFDTKVFFCANSLVNEVIISLQKEVYLSNVQSQAD